MAKGEGFKHLLDGSKNAATGIGGAVVEGAKMTGSAAASVTKVGAGAGKGGAKAAASVADKSAGLLGGILNSVGNFAQNHKAATFFALAFAGIRVAKKIVAKRQEQQQNEEFTGVPVNYAPPQMAQTDFPQEFAEAPYPPVEPAPPVVVPEAQTGAAPLSEQQRQEILSAMAGANLGPAHDGTPQDGQETEGHVEKLAAQPDHGPNVGKG